MLLAFQLEHVPVDLVLLLECHPQALGHSQVTVAHIGFRMRFDLSIAFDHQRVKVRSGFGVTFGGADVREEIAHGF
jgi:hypothetical protein